MHRAAHLLFVAALSVGFLGCEYVHPTLNAPLAKWDPHYGYRFANLAPPEEGNSNSLFVVASFSGGGTRASTLAFGALRVLARQPITWEGKEKRLLDELDLIYALSGGTFTGAYYALFGERIFHDFEYRFLRKDWESELKFASCARRVIGFASGPPTSAASISCPNCWTRHCMTARPTAIS